MSKKLHNGKDDRVKINSKFENFKNTPLQIKKQNARKVKLYTKKSNNNELVSTIFPFAKLKNPGLNLCFLNSAIQFILSIKPIADLLSQEHIKKSLTAMCLSQDYLMNYFNETPFLYEFEALAVSMLKYHKKTFLSETVAYNFQNLGICNYIVGEQWDSSEIIATFFTYYEKFINALQLRTLKSDILKTLKSIKTKEGLKEIIKKIFKGKAF